MNATILSKYLGVSFGGKTGSLTITSEKLIFRPKLTASEKAANVKPSARSWRWAAIDRVEILDPSRSATGAKLRSFKLKPKVAGHKTATLTIPSEKLENLVEDVNQRLSASSLGVEGILPSKVLPKNPMRVRSPVGKNTVHSSNADQNTYQPEEATKTAMESKAKEPTTSTSKEKAKESKEQPQTAQENDFCKPASKESPQRNTILATPTQSPKPKAAEGLTKRTSWTPPADLVFTPPTAKKEKVTQENFATPTTGSKKDNVQRDIIVTPPQEAKPSAKHFDIEFTPTRKEKGKIDALKRSNNKEEEEEDATSVSTRSSDLSHDSDDDQQQETSSQQPSKSKPQPPLNGQLWNPEAPEHRFRMMILQHAATCGWEKGTCQYDPICSQQKNLLAHIATCTEEGECTVGKCRSTKQFLLTMRLMKEMQQGNDSGAKDFLVGVGAVAPISVIELPNNKMGCSSNHSVVSESTWWSNDWGAVEDADGEESD